MAVPYIAPERSLPELTIKGVILGIILAAVLGAANAYLGLRVGLTVSASIPAAVISMAILKLFRKHNILENNAVQTAASAGESLAAGVIFTIPALLILDYWSKVSYWETTFIALAGGILGVLFTVPLRRALIVEAQLTFPEGVATSEVLKAGEAQEKQPPQDAVTPKGKPAVRKPLPGAGIGALLAGGFAGLAFTFMRGGLKLFPGSAVWGRRFKGDDGVVAFGSDLSPALLGVGYIIGLRISALVFAGGVIGWLIGIPLYSAFADGAPAVMEALRQGLREDALAAGVAYEAPSAVDDASNLWSKRIRYMGVGAMLVGGIWTLFKMRKPLGQAMMQGIKAAGDDDTKATLRTEQEFGIRPTFFGVLAMVVPIFFLYWYATWEIGPLHSFGVAMAMAVLMVITGFFFSAVAGYLAGLVGSSNNPISGVTILTVLMSAFLLYALGVPSTLGPAATIFVAGVIACAGAIAGDNMQDLKAGNILGSTPKKQQWMQIIGVTAAAFSVAPVLHILHTGTEGGIGGSNLAAPQAGLMAAVGDFVFNGGLPIGMISIGMGIAVALIIIDELLERRNAAFRTPVMPVAVGIYLPVGLSAPIFVGGLIAYMTGRRFASREKHDPLARGSTWWHAVADAGNRAGVLFSSGLIAGEALIGIGLAAIAVADIGGALAIGGGTFVLGGVLLFAYLILLLWYMVRRPDLVEQNRL